jgi:hypothetical protein
MHVVSFIRFDCRLRTVCHKLSSLLASHLHRVPVGGGGCRRDRPARPDRRSKDGQTAR